MKILQVMCVLRLRMGSTCAVQAWQLGGWRTRRGLIQCLIVCVSYLKSAVSWIVERYGLFKFRPAMNYGNGILSPWQVDFTLKYRSDFPAAFGSLQDARAFCQDFFAWYNTEHYHSGIAWHHPFDVHYGRDGQVHADRAEVLTSVYIRNPERFVRKPPEPKATPIIAWINKPAKQGEESVGKENS
jgi:hypothetical protein